jgi:hypothetical protein
LQDNFGAAGKIFVDVSAPQANFSQFLGFDPSALIVQ